MSSPITGKLYRIKKTVHTAYRPLSLTKIGTNYKHYMFKAGTIVIILELNPAVISLPAERLGERLNYCNNIEFLVDSGVYRVRIVGNTPLCWESHFERMKEDKRP